MRDLLLSQHDTTKSNSCHSKRRLRWAKTGAIVLASLIGIWSWVLFIRPGQVSRADSDGDGSSVAPVFVEPSVEEKQRKMVRGSWEDHYQDTHRILTIREDGTATMVVEMDGIAAFLVAPRLEFDIDWTIAAGRVSLKTHRGRPESKAGAILKIHGDHAEYHLDSLDQEKLVLRDVNKNHKIFEWRRLSEAEAAKVQAGSLLAKDTPKSE